MHTAIFTNDVRTRQWTRKKVSAHEILKQVFENVKLVALSLLLSTEAETVFELAQCISCVRNKLRPYIKSGQLYLTSQWRIRHEHEFAFAKFDIAMQNV